MIPDIEKIAEQSLLYDFYGQLLTERQRQIVEMYTQENLSLAEISQELRISRQAVHDALRNGQKTLEKYEDRLGLVSRFLKTGEAIEEIDGRILAIIEDRSRKAPAPGKKATEPSDGKLIKELEEIKVIIDGIRGIV